MSKNVAYSSISKIDGDDKLIEAVVLPDAPVASATQEFAQLRAPATLTGGYELTVEIDSENWVVLVPQGGVKEGELFRAEILHKVAANEAVATPVKATDPHSIPTGRWRDGLYDCCVHGCCHALCCLTTWCKPLALAQVMHRMNVSITGEQIPPGTGISPFKFMAALLIAMHIFGQILGAAIPPPVTHPDGTITMDPSFSTFMGIAHVLDFIFFVYFLFLVVKTRVFMRRTYNIPEERNCVGCEDLCCSLWCTCCVISQMARHTVDYTKYDPACCTETGVDEHVPPTLPNNKNSMVQVGAHIV